MSERILVTPEEAAERLAVSRARLYIWLGSGELASIKLGSSRRIEVAALERFVARHREDDAGETLLLAHSARSSDR